MGYGLGKDSPVILSLGKANYESMLDRHGQNVRWRVSKKCTCVTEADRVDPRCRKCGGSGEQYGFQKEYADSVRLRVMNNYVELPEENENCEVVKIFDSMGIEHTPVQTGKYIRLFSPLRELNNGEIVEVVFNQSIIRYIEEAQLESIGNGFYRVPGIQSDRSNIEGVVNTAPGDIVGMEAVFDSQGREVDILEFRINTVLLNDTEAKHPITAFGVKYIKPFKFFVLSQNLDEEDEKLLALHQGDAITTFPYHYDVSEGDIITVLSGTNTRKVALPHKGIRADDTLMDFFVQKVVYLATNRREYSEGKDFILVGANKIHWICDDPPEDEVYMSITYQYLPTYRVFRNVPMLRTSEDQRIPKKAVLKLLSAFSESQGVNVNG
jgi:hypothetical protein